MLEQRLRHHVGFETAAATYYEADFRYNFGQDRDYFVGLLGEFRLSTDAKFTPAPSFFFSDSSPPDESTVGELTQVFSRSAPVSRRVGIALGFVF